MKHSTREGLYLDEQDDRRTPAEPRPGEDVRGVSDDAFDDEGDDLDEDDELEEDEGSF